MKLGFDFEQNEAIRRSENYIRPAYNPYPIPENEHHAQKPIPENEPHAVDPEEKIDAEWSAIYSMLKVAHICEDMAKRYRNLGDHVMEESYITEATHAQETANLLYILTHK